MGSFNQAKYIQQFQKENYDRCIFNVPKGKKTKIESHFRNNGYKSLNSYVNQLINEDMEESKMHLSSEEEFIINRYRYGSDEDRKRIWKLILEIDESHTPEEKKRLFEQRQSEIKVKNNNGKNINDLINRDMEQGAGKSSKTVNIGRDNVGTINM